MLKKFMIGAAALTMAATPAMAQDVQDRVVRVENHSNSQYITSITLTNEHGRSYAVLPEGYISPGYNRRINMDDGERHGHCTFRVTARFQNGTFAQRVMNVCATTTWRIADLDNAVE